MISPMSWGPYPHQLRKTIVLVSTLGFKDGTYETAVRHPFYKDNVWIVVCQSTEWSDVRAAHNKWEIIMLRGPQGPITDVYGNVFESSDRL